MRINELLTEAQVQEGPILNKIGSGIGKAAGTVAKGVGAVAGGVAGLGSALKKGFQAGKATVGAAGDEPAAPAVSGSKTAPPTAAKAGSALAATGSNSAYAQVQKTISTLDPQQKKEILTMLQADPKVKAAMTAKPTDVTGGAIGAMAQQLSGNKPANTMATAPVSKTNVAKADNPNAPAAKGGNVAGQVSQTLDAVRKRNARRDKKNAAATTGASNQLGQQVTQQNASVEHFGTGLAETLAHKVQEQKQRMFETALIAGEQSVFKK